MKPLKVMYNGKHLKNIYPHATKWQVFKYRVAMFLRKVLIVTIIIATLYGVYKLGGIMNPAIVYTKAEVIKEVEAKAPILERIAKCESPTGHWKNGQVVININNNGSYDTGKYQINSIWNKKATEMGLNLMIEKDQDTFARWLYSTRGTEDWYSSKKCWQK
jgi:hypothetical protein